MKKITFLLLLSAFALFAEDPSPAQGHYELSPLDWKGKITLSLTGYLPAEGLSDEIILVGSDKGTTPKEQDVLFAYK